MRSSPFGGLPLFSLNGQTGESRLDRSLGVPLSRSKPNRAATTDLVLPSIYGTFLLGNQVEQGQPGGLAGTR
jgi:hypothetical protein